MGDSILTNEWYSVMDGRPYAGREVLCRLSTGIYITAIWNSMQWVDPRTGNRADYASSIVEWYMFEVPERKESGDV